MRYDIYPVRDLGWAFLIQFLVRPQHDPDYLRFTSQKVIKRIKNAEDFQYDLDKRSPKIKQDEGYSTFSQSDRGRFM